MGDRPVPVSVGPEAIATAWRADPLVLVAILAAGGTYVRGVTRLWTQVGRGALVRPAQMAAFLTGLGTVLLALVSPIEALAGTLFAGHMAQHVLLTLVAAPLLVLGAPVLPLLQGVPHRIRRPAARLHARAARLRRVTATGTWALAAVVVYAAVTWVWHVPAAYEAALRNELLHVAEHATLLGAAVLLWWTVAQSGRRSDLGFGMGLAVIFLTALQHGALGMLLLMAPGTLYGSYVEGAALWGLTPVQDQNLAGVLMLVPGKLIHAAAAAVLVIAWLGAVERRSLRREAARAGAAGGTA